MPRKIDTDALFEAVVNLFAERGYSATTTQEVAQRAGINEVTLFRRYGDKATLIRTALTHCLEQSPFAHLDPTEDLRGDLAAILDAYRMTFGAYGGAVLTLMIEMPRNPELRSALSALQPNILNAGRIIAHHQEAGRLGPGEPLQKLVLLFSPIMVSGILARTGANLPVQPFETETIVTAFLRGHAADPGFPRVEART